MLHTPQCYSRGRIQPCYQLFSLRKRKRELEIFYLRFRTAKTRKWPCKTLKRNKNRNYGKESERKRELHRRKAIDFDPSFFILIPSKSFSINLDEKLRCRRETARCFLSLYISLSRQSSLKIIRNDTIEYGVCKSLLVVHRNYTVRETRTVLF